MNDPHIYFEKSRIETGMLERKKKRRQVDAERCYKGQNDKLIRDTN